MGSDSSGNMRLVWPLRKSMRELWRCCWNKMRMSAPTQQIGWAPRHFYWLQWGHEGVTKALLEQMDVDSNTAYRFG